MTLNKLPSFSLSFLLACTFFLSGCEQLGFGEKQSNALGNRPELDCIIANDFYAVHFSAYLQPDKNDAKPNAKEAFVPYCQKIPRAGKMYFTADLFDRDVRTTPIGIRLVEVEKTGKKAPDDFREIRTISETPAKLYPRGAVEAQADVDKNGNYALYLLIGDAIEEDDKFRIPFEVGVEPNDNSMQWIAGIAVALAVMLGLGFLVYWYKAKPHKKGDSQT